TTADRPRRSPAPCWCRAPGREEGTVSGLGNAPGRRDVALPLPSPRVHPRVHVPAAVVSTRRAFLLAPLPGRRAHPAVDADHPAGRPLRRHGISVADRSRDTHPCNRTRTSSVLRVPIHPEVRWATSATPTEPP